MSDVSLSVLALIVMHGVLQLFIYPVLNKTYGVEKFGTIVSAYGMITIFSASAGLAANNIQLKRKEISGKNSSFIIIAAVLSGIGSGLALLFSIKVLTGVVEILLFFLMSFLTGVRTYGDVFYRQKLNYKKYFLYYLILTFGYVLGILGMRLDYNWSMVFIIGEMVALIYLWISRDYVNDATETSQIETNRNIWSQCVLLYLSFLVYYIALNWDKILLLYMQSGEAVTVFYVASLIGKTFSLLIGSFNAILLSYLASSKAGFSLKLWKKLVVGILLLSTLAFAFCVLFTPLVSKVLYPQVYAEVKSIYVITNLSQIICFACSIFLTVLLFLSDSKMQLMIQVISTLLLVVISPFGVAKWGIMGYSVSLLIVYIVKFMIIYVIARKKVVNLEKKRIME